MIRIDLRLLTKPISMKLPK